MNIKDLILPVIRQRCAVVVPHTGLALPLAVV